MAGTLVLTDTLKQTVRRPLRRASTRAPTPCVRSQPRSTPTERRRGSLRPTRARARRRTVPALPASPTPTAQHGYAQLVGKRRQADRRPTGAADRRRQLEHPTPRSTRRHRERHAPSGPGEVVIDKPAADNGQASRSATRRHRDRRTAVATYTIVGIAKFGTDDSLAGPRRSSRLTAAQVARPARPRSTTIRSQAAPGVSQTAGATRIQAVTARAHEALTGARARKESPDAIEQGHDFFNTS